MTYFDDGSGPALEEEQQHTEEHEVPRPVGARLGEFRERVTRALGNFDRGRLEHLRPEREEMPDETEAVIEEVPDAEEDLGFAGPPAPFPTARRGYDPQAVEARIAELEEELEELRGSQPALSITEELERLGEQTASILVVAHDKAHETARLAQEQADRCVADAAANAVAITEKAKRDLREIDEETDAVWRERARLIEDARNVGSALVSMADEALKRFPAEGKTADAAREG